MSDIHHKSFYIFFYIMCLCWFDAVPAVVLCGQMQVFLRSHTCVWVKDHFREGLPARSVSEKRRTYYFSIHWNYLSYRMTCGFYHIFVNMWVWRSWRSFQLWVHVYFCMLFRFSLRQFKSSNFSNNVSVKSYLMHESERSRTSEIICVLSGRSQNRCCLQNVLKWHTITYILNFTISYHNCIIIYFFATVH